ncbi:uncharacterized protein LOC120087891 [Benincasa hispida]|uniref:uncharacterized protein LOC120087891 n=1 Tax=Benincasa hispida TaxID=102211 RepID=UPI001900883E|nr:uncharacterized protein LOC120087891 [Benincasa hispida]
MASLEEEKLVQMVDDFIESADHTPSSCSFANSSNSLPLNSKSHYFLSLKEILGSGIKAEGEVGETVMKHLRSWKSDSPKTTSSLKKWLVMKLKMDGYDSSDLCHTSWVTSMGCPAGDYEYIEMKVKDEYGSRKRVIIDIEFKAQFEVARATEEYKQLTEALPTVFVGSEERVKRIISVLCSAAKQSLKESGLHIPPWRTSTYMHCKWLHRSHSISNNNNNHKETNNNFINNKYWKPPMVKPISRRVWGGASALSTQFSNMSINCC